MFDTSLSFIVAVTPGSLYSDPLATLIIESPLSLIDGISVDDVSSATTFTALTLMPVFPSLSVTL